MLKDKIVDFSTAKLAQEKGFSALTDYFYHEWLEEDSFDDPRSGDIRVFKEVGQVQLVKNSHVGCKTNRWCAPTQSLLQRWLREVHNIHIQNHFLNGKYAVKIKYNTNKSDNVYNKDTYEDALEEGLRKALNLIR